MKKEILFLIVFLLFVKTASASLGIGPAVTRLNFEPGAVYTFDYSVVADDPDKEINVYAEGDLAQYVTLSREKMKGPGAFKVTLKLPENIDKPGDHPLYIGARESPPEDVFIGTVINIRAVIYVFVPYPGRYAEVLMNVPNGNINDTVPVETKVINRGDENISLVVKTDFYNSIGESIDTFTFEPVFLGKGEERYFRRYLNTTGYRPGTYLAESTAYFGDTVKANQTFRIGSMYVNVTNFTERLPQEGIQKFYVNIESLWNSELGEVYADVNVSNGVQNQSFRTPSVALGGWEKKMLVGFIDTTDMSGEYLTEVILSYSGQKTIVNGKLEIYQYNTTLIVAAVIAALLAIIVGIWIWRKNK